MRADYEGCPRCGGQHVVAGYLKVQNDIFDQVRIRLVTEVANRTTLGWLFNWGVSFPVPIHFELCVECGLLWNSLDPSSIRKRFKAKAGPEALRNLGLTNKAKQPIDDFDGPV